MDKFFSLWRKKEEVSRSPEGSYKKPESVLLSERLKEEYKSARESWAEQAEKNLSFVRGAQLTTEMEDALKAANHQPIIVNVLQSAVEQAIAMLTHNDPKFSATAREDSDMKTASCFAGLMQYIWQNSDASAELKTAVYDYYVVGLGSLMTYVDPYADYGKGEIKIVSIDPFDLFLSPNCKDQFGRDSEHIIVSKIMSAEQIVSLYPETEELLAIATPTREKNFGGYTTVGMGAQGNNPTSIKTNQYDVIDRYSKVNEIDLNIFNPENGRERIFIPEEYVEFLDEIALYLESINESKWITEEEEIAQILPLAEQGGGYFHIMQDIQSGQMQPMPGIEHGQDPNTPNLVAVPDSTTKVIVASMADAVRAGALIENKFVSPKILRVISIGGVEYFNNIDDIDSHNIVTFMNHHNRTPYPISDVEGNIGLQEQINKIESLIVAHASNSVNVKWWVPKGSADPEELEEKMGQAGTALLSYNPELGIPIQAGPVQLPNELYKNKADKIAEIERSLGIYAMQQGDASAAPNTYKGTIALDEYGQRRIKSKRDDIEKGLNVLNKVVVQLIQRTYTEHKVLRIVNPNNLPSERVEINQPMYTDYSKTASKINDVTVGHYDLIVVSGSTLPSNRWAKAEYYKELLQMGAIDQQEFLMKTEVADVEGVLARSGQINQMSQAIQQLEAQVKSLEGDKQTSDRQIVHLKQSVEVEKFKTALATPRASIQKSAQLYDARRGDELTMMQKELNMVKQLETREKVN